MTNAMIRPSRPQTSMRLTGVSVYGVDLSVMLAKLLVGHGYLTQEPADLNGLLEAGDAAVAALENATPEVVLCSKAEVVEVVSGLHKALSRVLADYNPDSIEAEWLGHSNELIVKLTGRDMNGNDVRELSARTKQS